MISIDLTGKLAFVTGAARGLGKATALAYAKAGADLFICDIIEDALKETAKEITAMGVKCNYCAFDVSKYDEYVAALDKAGEKVDIIAHCAGIMVSKGMLLISDEEIRKIIDINIIGVDNAYRAGLRKMIPFNDGAICSLASVAGRHGSDIHSHYHMTKAAVISLNQSAALWGAKHHVTCNTICPGIIRTPMWENILDHQSESRTPEAREKYWKEAIKDLIPMGEAQTAEDISNAILFLTSPMAKCITGQALNVCGGMEMN